MQVQTWATSFFLKLEAKLFEVARQSLKISRSQVIRDNDTKWQIKCQYQEQQSVTVLTVLFRAVKLRLQLTVSQRWNYMLNHLSGSQNLPLMETNWDWQATSASNCCSPALRVWQPRLLALSDLVVKDRQVLVSLWSLRITWKWSCLSKKDEEINK